MLFEDILRSDSIWQKAFIKAEAKYGERSEEYNLLNHLFSKDKREQYIKALLEGSFVWTVPAKVSIAKIGTTKKRIVYMYTTEERFLQGVLYRALSDYYDYLIAENCFSYKKSTTTLDAIKYIDKSRKSKNMYGLKMDISSYFNSVPKDYLRKTFDNTFVQSEMVGIKRCLERMFFDDTVTIKGVMTEEYKSLIAGSPLGSFFANICLTHIDNMYPFESDYVYARYSDDILILAETQEEIEIIRSNIKRELELVGLKINPKKYESFSSDEPVEYLGLELGVDYIDISKNSKDKVKRTIKRWIKKARKEIELGHTNFEKAAFKLVRRYNHRMFKTYIIDPTKYGWGYYAFRFITTYKSLAEIDLYFMNQLRYLKTGKHNKMNGYALTEKDYYDMRFISLVDMYKLFKEDFDYYKEVVYLM